MNIEKNMDLFLRLLSNAEYYQAHEVVERLWIKLKKENDPLANLIKGMINAAVAFEHIKRASPRAFVKAQKTFAGFIKYKDECKYMSNEFKIICTTIEQKAKEMNLL